MDKTFIETLKENLSIEKKNLANLITCVRLIGTVCMVFSAPLSLLFYVLYLICGISDAVDGLVARKYNLTSEFGSKLDSASDLLFYFVMIMKIMPNLIAILPSWVWWMVAAIATVRIISYGLVAIIARKFSSLHTYLNKLTGLFVFLVPIMLSTRFAVPYCITVVFVACISSLQELAIHIANKE